MKTFKDIWKIPLKLDDYGLYAYSENNVMALTFADFDIKSKRKIIDIINDNCEEKVLEKVIYDPNCQTLEIDGKVVAIVRGWGHLKHVFDTHKDAAKCQDDFGNWIANKLNKNEKDV